MMGTWVLAWDGKCKSATCTPLNDDDTCQWSNTHQHGSLETLSPKGDTNEFLPLLASSKQLMLALTSQHSTRQIFKEDKLPPTEAFLWDCDRLSHDGINPDGGRWECHEENCNDSFRFFVTAFSTCKTVTMASTGGRKMDKDASCPVPMDQTPTSVVAACAEEKGTLPSVAEGEEESAVTSSLFICPCNKKHTLFGRCCRHIRDECSKGSESVLCNLSKDKKAAVAEANESSIGARFSVQIPHVSVLSNTKKVPSNIGRLVTNSTHRRTMQPK